MKRIMSSKAGFTLVELMVVAIIVALLAAVAIPLMSANKKRAAATEGEAGLGTIRSALRAVYAEKNSYNVNLQDAAIGQGTMGGSSKVPGIGTNDLDGTYFKQGDYSIAEISDTAYKLQVTGNASNKYVGGVTITLDQDGKFTYTGL